MIKGGIWKNIEDEILKAAVMKYGLNQWSRISSLLVRKSAKQCKARWYEWLDPSIKKTEWSKSEEEKLLHLAKLFPNQWRTIAPGIGRTPAQCIEHYEQLLEEAAGKQYDPETDPRKLRPGEIDPCPETRAPRPDPVDMDEDEKEMLQEARARLSNTRGKKAKRKMREKQLEEGRRLATVQRKRELRASGIEMELKKRIKPKVREMDYNVEIPFEHMVPSGKFVPDVSELPSKDELRISAQHIEGSMRAEQEAKKKIEDGRKMKRLKEMNLPAAIQKVNDLNEFKVPMKRFRLDLPKARFSETEIYELGKGLNVENGRVTDMLVENKAKVEGLEEVGQVNESSSVMAEAYNAYWRSNMSTPLVGGDSEPVVGVGVGGMNMTPKKVESEAELKVIRKYKKNKDGQEEEQEQEELGVKSYLDLLPKPENSYEMAEDSSESESEHAEELQEEAEVPLETSVVQRNLPRPYVFNPKRYLEDQDNLVGNEVVTLVLYDMHHFPMKGGKKLEFCVDKELIDNKRMSKALDLIKQQQAEFPLDLEKTHSKFAFSSKKKSGVPVQELRFEDLEQNLKNTVKYYEGSLAKTQKKIEDLKASVLEKSKDPADQVKKLEKNIRKKVAKMMKLRQENSIFERLFEREKEVVSRRVEEWKGRNSLLAVQEVEYQVKLQEVTQQIAAWEWCNSTY